METVRNRLYQCQGKYRHHVWETAVVEARRLAAEEYRCPHCGHWHVGHGEYRLVKLVTRVLETLDFTLS